MKKFLESFETSKPVNAAAEEDDAGWAAKYDLEKRVCGLIEQVFDKVGVVILRSGLTRGGHSAISFDHDTREATVKLEENEVMASKLAGLMQSGLADDFKVESVTSYGLWITFIVNPEIASGRAVLDK